MTSSPPVDGRTRGRLLITGASSGLGAGMARVFASRGRDVVLCARRGEALHALQSELLAAYPARCVTVAPLDVTDHDAVFSTFRTLGDEAAGLDTVIVNAGIGAGVPIGRGGFVRNLAIVETNFTAALAQCEAAMEVFRARGAGHLVIVSSISAMRGLRGGLTAYAASKAAVAALGEGIRADVLRTPAIKVTTLFPGFIRTEMTAGAPARRTPFIIDAERGCRLLADAVERAPAAVCVPMLPWAPIGWLMRHLPLALVARLS